MKFVKPISSCFIPSEWNFIPTSSSHTAERSLLLILLNPASLTGTYPVYRLFFSSGTPGHLYRHEVRGMPHLTQLTAGNKKKKDLRWRKNKCTKKKGPDFIVLALLKYISHPWSLPEANLQRLEKTMHLASQFRKDIRTELLGGPQSWKSACLLVKVPYYGFMSLPFGWLLSLFLL